MVALNYVVVHRSGARGYGLKYLVLEVESATTADTVTVDEFTAVKDTVAFQTDTGDALACTEATNVVTIGGAIAAKPLAIFVSGH